MLDAVITDLKTKTSNGRSLHWVDLSFGENNNSNVHADVNGFRDSVVQLDEAVLKIYNAAPVNSCVVVVTQGSLRPLKIVNSQKLRYFRMLPQLHETLSNSNYLQKSLGDCFTEEEDCVGELWSHAVGCTSR